MVSSWARMGPGWAQVGAKLAYVALKFAQDPPKPKTMGARKAATGATDSLSPPRTPPIYLTPAMSFMEHTFSWDECQFPEYGYRYGHR